MPLLKDGRVVADGLIEIDGEQPLPSAEAILVSLTRWKKDRAKLLARNMRLGVKLAGEDPAEAIAVDLARIDLIAIVFLKFTDGRGYSTA